MATTVLPTDLAEEIKRLNQQLLQAEDSRITSADRRVAEIRQQLADAQRAFELQQECEALAIAEQQHAHDLQHLLQLEHQISNGKTEVDTLRTMLTELPQRLSRAQWELSQLLRQHSSLKSELKG